MSDKEKGIFFPKVDFRIENAMILSINDASHAASFIDGEQAMSGHRPQAGRILALASRASRDFRNHRQGEGLSFGMGEHVR